MAVATVQGIAQQDEGPILRPKKPPARPASATLLVMCDLACDWKLDGEAKGRIEAGGSAKVKVELGQHMVVAATEDGADQFKQLSEVKVNGQTLVNIELQPVRDARLKAEQQARDRVAQEARDKAPREQAGRVWTDPATGLMWTKKDNGSDVNWQQAISYCRNLQLAGYSDWRLPEIDELQGIYDPDTGFGGSHVKGNLQLSGWDWSSSQNHSSEDAWLFYFSKGEQLLPSLGNYRTSARALCVRRSGE
jgi:hypothetical protein